MPSTRQAQLETVVVSNDLLNLMAAITRTDDARYRVEVFASLAALTDTNYDTFNEAQIAALMAITE